MKNRTALVLSVGLFLLAAVVFAFIRLSGRDTSTGDIVLPQGAASAGEETQIAQSNLRAVRDIEITPENVKQVIATLSRASQYHCAADLTYYLGESSAELHSESWVNGRRARVILYTAEGAVSKQIILTEENAYIWGETGEIYYKGARGDFSADSEARIPTYEDILALADEDITEAGITDFSGALCVYAACRSGAGIMYYYVDTATGMLKSCTLTENGTIAYTMEQIVFENASVGDSHFYLPTGVLAE